MTASRRPWERMRRVAHLALWVAVLGLGLMVAPSEAHSQAASSAVRVRGDAGVVVLTAGGCPRQSAPGILVGLDVRSRGTWFVAGGVDVIFGGAVEDMLGGSGCTASQPLATYGGEVTQVRGGTSYSPGVRGRLGVAYAVSGLGWKPEAGLGVGVIPTRSEFGIRGETSFTWQPWIGGTLAVQPWDRFGARLEVGQHRLPTRYYGAVDDRLVGEELFWHWMVGTTVSIALLR